MPQFYHAFLSCFLLPGHTCHVSAENINRSSLPGKIAFLELCLFTSACKLGMFTLVSAWIKKHAKAMLSKNKRGYEIKTVPFRKRFRANLSDAYLAGSLTAARAANLFTDAQSAGAGGIEDLAGLGEKNANRSLKRRLLKNNHWPKLYWADIPIFDPKQQVQKSAPMPFILPHELVATFFPMGRTCIYSWSTGFARGCRFVGQACCSMPATQGSKDFVSAGHLERWSPCNFDRTQSLEVVAMSFPSLPGIRVPLSVTKKCFSNQAVHHGLSFQGASMEL